jgi:hypothetical protein
MVSPKPRLPLRRASRLAPGTGPGRCRRHSGGVDHGAARPARADAAQASGQRAARVLDLAPARRPGARSAALQRTGPALSPMRITACASLSRPPADMWTTLRAAHRGPQAKQQQQGSRKREMCYPYRRSEAFPCSRLHKLSAKPMASSRRRCRSIQTLTPKPTLEVTLLERRKIIVLADRRGLLRR